MKENEPLRIAAFFDGSPGHEKQTQSVIEAISTLTPVHVHPINVQKKSLFETISSYLAWATGRFFPMENRILGASPDLVMGTGSATHLPMLHFRARGRARIVVCMTPDFFLRKKMDLCLVPMHDAAKAAENIFFTTGPPCGAGISGEHDPGKGLVLAGGVDPKSHVWDTDAIVGKIETILEKEGDVQWVVSSSPRTPDQTEQRLAALAKARPNAEFFRAADTPRGWVEQAYADSFQAWITADSISMVYEALTAGCRVGILPVSWKKRSGKFQKSVDDLINNHRADSFDSWISGQSRERASARFDEAGRCAAEILGRWWPERL